MFCCFKPATSRTNSSSQASHAPAPSDAIANARNTIGRGDAHAAVCDLSPHLSEQRAFHEAILTLLDSSAGQMRQELIKEACRQRPDFDLHAHDKEGKTLLDLAVRHDDQEFARYLLGQGARPEKVPLGTATNDMQTLLTSWRRKNLLYAHFNERNRKSWAPLDHLLHKGRHEEVRSRLEGMLTENDMHKVWEEAMGAGMHDVLRCLLVAGTPDELRKLTKEKHLVGQWIEALKDDPGLSAVLKEFPYQSAKRGKPENFNKEAKFIGVSHKAIVCRHLATYQQEVQTQNPRIKFDYDQFNSREKIAINVKPDIEKTYKTLKAHASETHLIKNSKFGQFLVRQLEAMEKDGKQSKLMLMQSTIHAMNLGLRTKEKNGEKSYVVKFFDPNDTTTGTRSKTNSVQTFETQTLASYITDADKMKGYYPEPMGMSMIFVRPEEEAQASTSMLPAFSAGRTLTSMDIKDNEDNEGIDTTVIWHLMSEGFAGNLRKLRGHFAALPEHLFVEPIAGKNAKGYPALYAGMNNGHADAIRAYGELLKQFESLPEDQLIELISGESATGYSALFVGMHEGHAEAIKACGDLLKLLPPDRQADLLLAKISRGAYKGQSGLHIALAKGHFSAANELLQLLTQLAPALSAEQRAMLQNELKDGEEIFAQSTTTSSSSLQEWIKLKGAFSVLNTALSQ